MHRTKNSAVRRTRLSARGWSVARGAALILAFATVVAPATAANASPAHPSAAVRASASVHVVSRPLHASVPKISGRAVVGAKLSAHPGTWTAGTHFSYQWLASGRAIHGATHSTFVLHAAQKGKRISVRVAGTRHGYTRTVKTSASTAIVRAAARKPAVPANPGNSVNCSDFATHAQAQAWFKKYYPYYGDVARLDADHDGIACEDLP